MIGLEDQYPIQLDERIKTTQTGAEISLPSTAGDLPVLDRVRVSIGG